MIIERDAVKKFVSFMTGSSFGPTKKGFIESHLTFKRDDIIATNRSSFAIISTKVTLKPNEGTTGARIRACAFDLA